MALSLSRRDYLKLAAAGVLAGSTPGWFQALARDAAKNPQRKKSCILLWMGGGPSQIDTFDVKPGHANGGPTKEIQTATAGMRISEHLPTVAKHTDRMAIIRSMSTKEGDHGMAATHMHTGYPAFGPILYPTFGAVVAKELGDDELALPHFVSIGQVSFPEVRGSGFLGPKYAPMVIGGVNGLVSNNDDNYEKALRVGDLEPPSDVTPAQSAARAELLQEMQKEFLARHAGPAAANRNSANDRAIRLMQTSAARAFDLNNEPEKLRDRYGRNRFGQGCLMARRLIEQGVPFVEIGLSSFRVSNWDSHTENFESVARMCGILDPAWGTLMEDLQDKGLLDSTLVIWMGEFGRTPKINPANGRDHYPNAWSTVLAGGGIKGGQVVGKTSKDGTTVEERPVSGPDFFATVCRALGLDRDKQNVSNIGRPIRIVDKAASAIKEVIA
jgi:uncharacterized protein (DUF1501 family)